MRAYFHSDADNRPSINQWQLRLLICAFAVLFLWVFFVHLVQKPSASIQKKKTLLIFGIIESRTAYSTGSVKANVKIPSGDVIEVTLSDLPWEDSSCQVGAEIKGIAKAYPLRRAKTPVIGQAWFRSYSCEFSESSKPAFKLPKAGDSLGVLLSSTTGSKDLLSDECRKVFRILGISHLLVISGFHMGIVFSCIYFFVSSILKRSDYLLSRFIVSKISVLLSLLLCFLYLLNIDSGVPAIRAYLMLLVASFAHVLDRKLVSLRNVFFVASLISILSPEVVITPGFLLSFSAVFGLVLVSGKFLRPKTKMSKLLLAFYMSFTAWSFSAPVAIFFFKSISLLSPFINFFVMPVFSFLVIILGGFLLIVVKLLPSFFLPIFEGYLGYLDLGIEMLWSLSEFLVFQHVSIEDAYLWPSILTFISINFLLVFYLQVHSNRRLDMLARHVGG